MHGISSKHSYYTGKMQRAMALTSRVSVSVSTEVVCFRPSFYMGRRRVVSVVAILTFRTSLAERSYGPNLFLFEPVTSSFRRIMHKPNYEFSRGWLKSLLFGKYSMIRRETSSMSSPQYFTARSLVLTRRL